MGLILKSGTGISPTIRAQAVVGRLRWPSGLSGAQSWYICHQASVVTSEPGVWSSILIRTFELVLGAIPRAILATQMTVGLRKQRTRNRRPFHASQAALLRTARHGEQGGKRHPARTRLLA